MLYLQDVKKKCTQIGSVDATRAEDMILEITIEGKSMGKKERKIQRRSLLVKSFL